MQCNSTLFLPPPSSLHVPVSPRTGEDRRVELRYRNRWCHRIREAGQRRLEACRWSGGGDRHRRHPQLPHSDFPRVQNGQRFLQRLGPGGLIVWWSLCRVVVGGGAVCLVFGGQGWCFHSLSLTSYFQPGEWYVYMHRVTELQFMLYLGWVVQLASSTWVAFN